MSPRTHANVALSNIIASFLPKSDPYQNRRGSFSFLSRNAWMLIKKKKKKQSGIVRWKRYALYCHFHCHRHKKKKKKKKCGKQYSSCVRSGSHGVLICLDYRHSSPRSIMHQEVNLCVRLCSATFKCDICLCVLFPVCLSVSEVVPSIKPCERPKTMIKKIRNAHCGNIKY